MKTATTYDNYDADMDSTSDRCVQFSYAANFGRSEVSHQRRNVYRRRNSQPSSSRGMNGIHRRRNRRWDFGSGRSAAKFGVRVAGCIAALAALFCGGPSIRAAVVNDFVEVAGTPNTNKAGNGYGTVATTFQIARYETTNTQYAAFLNSVARTSDTFSLFNSSMGITKSTVGGTSTYTPKANFEDRPIAFVSAVTAARYVNWLNAGMSGTANLNAGSYSISGSTLTKNPGQMYYLPTADQWTKAGFYLSGSNTYYTWGTSSDTAPTPSSTNSANSANYNNQAAFSSLGNVAPVNLYAASLSPYGLYGISGNVAEWTDTASTTAGQYWMLGGSFNRNTTTTQALLSSNGSSLFSFGATSANSTTGFRVVQAVPEPGTLALAFMGGASTLATVAVQKRRRKKSA